MFYPELHDLGKMFDKSIFIDDKGMHLNTDVDKAKQHSLANLDWSAFGLDEPVTLTWKATKLHHEKEKEIIKLTTLDPEEKKIILLLIFADRLAAQFGRMHTLERAVQLPNSTYVRKPWEPFSAAKPPASEENLIRSKEGFADIINKIAAGMSWEEFKKEYHSCLATIPEDKTIGNSLHTLLDHMELTGRFYSLLSGVLDVELNGADLVIKYPSADQQADNIGRAQQEFLFHLVRADIKIPHRFARTGDLALFLEVEEALEQIEKGPFSKYVLFGTPETIWFFLPVKASPVDVEKELEEMGEIFRPLTALNCFCMLQVVTGPADGLKPGYLTYKKEIRKRIEKLQKEKEIIDAEIKTEIAKLEQEKEELRSCLRNPKTDREKKAILGEEIKKIDFKIRECPKALEAHQELINKLLIYNDSPGRLLEKYENKISTALSSVYDSSLIGEEGKTIEPPICEVCQLERAFPGVPKDKTEEFLCQKCINTREKKPRLGRLAEWEEKDFRVAWVKIALDYDVYAKIQLENFVNWLIGFYDEGGKKKLHEAEAAAMFNPSAAHAVLTRDYNEFLADLNSVLENEFGRNVFFLGKKEKCELFVFGIERSFDLEKIFKTFIETMERHFNFFSGDRVSGNQPSPVRFSASISNIRYPFYRHWDFLKKPSDDVNIFAPNKGTLSVPGEKLKYLLGMRRSLEQNESKTLMHRLALLEGKLGKLAMEIEILKEKRLHISRFLREVMHKDIAANEILRYFKIVLWDM